MDSEIGLRGKGVGNYPSSIWNVAAVADLRGTDFRMPRLDVRTGPVEADAPASAHAAVALVPGDLLMHRDTGQHHAAGFIGGYAIARRTYRR